MKTKNIQRGVTPAEPVSLLEAILYNMMNPFLMLGALPHIPMKRKDMPPKPHHAPKKMRP